MEPGKLITAIGALGLVASFGVGIMSWAYKGAGSVAVLFREVMPVPKTLAASGQPLFQQGIAAYITGQYRRAAERFEQVLKQQTDCAAAAHNLGLAHANLRQDDRAARDLLKAAELYLQQDDRASADLVKRQLEKLRQRKLAREQLGSR
ncbi:hypothetical protein IQ266_18770 [filamentous cyanobacterium LEGE 11480]|uniref:Tetratricopeptide repeat protein n=1 Tax=Romeriopsis navalis LEGE 11480 TaxID=2777977 RepID=A0A928VRT1_9CYAN|nr:hypothetical protein [Romeriopsis navalis]MBE9031781.1 hypothetical protein [Romeriopsis navalis LEGE 11480]